MEPRSSCALGRQLQQLGAEMGALQAGQAAALRELARELARERAQARRLQEKVARLQEKLRLGQQLQHPPQATATPASAQPQESGQPDGTSEVARLQEELAQQRAQREALAKDYQALRHSYLRLRRRVCSTRCPRCLEGSGDTQGPLPVYPGSKDPQDIQSHSPEGTQRQRRTVGFKPFIFFIVASTIIFLYPCQKEC